MEESPGFLALWRDEKLPLDNSNKVISVLISQMGKLVKEGPEVEIPSPVDTK